MKKVLLLYGTRPEAIKMAPIIKKFQENKSSYDLIVCSTGQHKDMLGSVETFFDIKPDIQLNVNMKEPSLSKKYAELIFKMSDKLSEVKPDKVIVHGDTLSAVSTAMAAFMNNVQVLHVEAGLRTNTRKLPFPEEFNRRTITNLASIHFAPTQSAFNNLINEGIPQNSLFLVGNTVIDALKFAVEKIMKDQDLYEAITNSFIDYCEFNLKQREYVLITGHRRENFGKGFKNICVAIKELATLHPEVIFIYPVHLNPNVREPVNTILKDLTNVKLIEPQDYPHFVYLMMNAKLILTDSGGIQEEAPSLGKPLILMRDETERPEVLQAGLMEIVGTDLKKIIEAVDSLLTNSEKYESMAKTTNLYGDGEAGKRIFDILQKDGSDNE